MSNDETSVSQNKATTKKSNSLLRHRFIQRHKNTAIRKPLTITKEGPKRKRHTTITSIIPQKTVYFEVSRLLVNLD